ncbi:NHL repeat-containing protein [bacterium]|nr:NHL repeat-containing protein [bacterium]
MSAKRVLLLFIVLVEVAILAVITGAGIPGAPTSATDSSQDAPMIEKLSPKCIDLSGFDQALEELLMLLKGDSVKTVTSGMLEYSSGFSLQTMDWATEAALGFPPEEIEPARMLGSLLENGPNLNLRKVLVNREQTRAYFDDPQVLAFTSSGSLIYADSAECIVRILNGNGDLVCEFGSKGYGPGEFQKPVAIAADPLGRIYIADFERGDVQVFSEAGDYAGVLAKGLAKPVAMAVFGDMELYILERDAAKVHVFNLDLMEEVRSFGGVGEKPGRYRNPSSIAITRLGNIIIADSGNDRVQVVNRRGKVEQVWDNIRYPQYVASDRLNNVYILADTILKVASNGSQIGEWDRSINFPDGTSYFLGNGIYPELKNMLMINDRYYGNVLVYELTK